MGKDFLTANLPKRRRTGYANSPLANQCALRIRLRRDL